MAQLADYCSHFKLLGFLMVEHRYSGSWLVGEAPLSPGGVMDFSGGSLSSGSEWSLPSDHPISDERGGVAPWTAEADFHGLSLKQAMVARPGARNVVRGALSLQS